LTFGLLGSPFLLGHLLLLLPLLLVWLARWTLVGGLGVLLGGRDGSNSSERWMELRLIIEHVVQAVGKVLDCGSLRIVVLVVPGLWNHSDSEDEELIDIGDILGVTDIEDNFDVLGSDVSDASVSEDKWVVVCLPDLDGSITPFRSESGVDVVSVWVDGLDVVSLKSSRPDDNQIVTLRPVPVGGLKVGKSRGFDSAKNLGHLEIVKIRLEGVVEWVVDEAVSSELELTGVGLEHADWACGVSNAHLFFCEFSEEVIRAPVAVGFTVADAVDGSVNTSSVGGWDGVWVSTADLVGLDLLWLASEWTESGIVAEEATVVEAGIEGDALGLGWDTWVDVLDTGDWLLVDLADVSVSVGSAVD